ncbi:MAG TPA: deoxyribonuclease IV [Thermodesulfobacteriota bacterium]|nr:deoxyribonuclease IV [Thermodesulfobacteriota bacterium]
MTAVFFRLGVHVSIGGGIEKAIDRARELGCSAMQIFSRNPRGWKTSPLSPQSVKAFREAARKSDIDPIVIHTPYLLNLASGDGALHRRSIRVLAQDLKRAEDLGARFVVTHLGSGKEKSPVSSRRQVIRALRQVLKENFSVLLLLENSAGAGNTVGATFEEIAEIVEETGKDPRIGFCFDSCHGFSAGYDFRSEEQSKALAQEVSRTMGVERLKLLHLNDCLGPLGGHLDRHQHIGKGEIGMEGFRNLLSQVSFPGVAMILETPKKAMKDDLENLSRIRGIIQSLREQPESQDSVAGSG